MTLQSNSSKTVIVQKYGGTSVGTGERMLQVAEILKDYAQHHQLIVVLSAMSSYRKSQGTTSRLLEAAQEVLKPNSQRYLDIIDSIQESHLEAIQEAVTDLVIKEQVEKDVMNECQRLRSFMAAAEIIDEISPKSRDSIISTGEKLSARIMTAVLRSQNIQANYVSLDKLIDSPLNENSVDQQFYDQITRILRDRFSHREQGITVVTGFLGRIPGSILTTVGRGYTDLTAALIAVATQAQELQIWKEVDGIFTADPRKVEKALLLPHITPEETAEITYYGSEVVHPFTMEQVIRASIPIRIKNTFSPHSNGTVIIHGTYFDEQSNLKDQDKKHPTAVTIKEGIMVINVRSNRKSVAHGFFEKIFSTLDRFGIVIDLISTSQVHISMALGPNVLNEKLQGAIEALKAYGTVDVSKDLAILSLVGKQMRHMVGIASKMFSTLAKHHINIEMISQGASEINISCVISQCQADLALKVVHDECIIGYKPMETNAPNS